MNVEPDGAIAAQVAGALGAEPRSWISMAHRGCTNNARWIVRFTDGRTAFVKAAVDRQTAGWLRAEQRVYSNLHAPFLPRLLAWIDGDLPVLVLEDLQDAHWPPPWTTARIDAVRRLLHEVAATPPPQGLGRLEDEGARLQGWSAVETDPRPFLRLGLCSADWLRRNLPALRAASEGASLAGDALVHLDVRSDNLCLRGERSFLVDWNLAVVGNPLIDLVGWLPSLRMEGGPLPDEIAGEGAGELAALLAGYWAARAGLPPPPTAPRVRAVQLAQLRVALPWAARVLGLPAPNV